MDTQSSPSAKPAVKGSRRKFYAAVSAAIVIVILVASFIVAPPGEIMDLRLNYSVGERMVYEATETVVNRWVNASNPPEATDTRNYILALDVIDEASASYIINQTQASALALLENNQPDTRNESRNPCLSVLMPPGGPLIFWNVSNSPTLGHYLEETSVRTGDVWTLPLDCANASLGLTGEVTVAFAGIEEVTVPAGTYRAIRIEVTSSTLTVNPDSHTPYPVGITLQFNATTYLEQSTCRLIKTELSQETHLSALGTENVAMVRIEETLIKHTKP